MVRLGSLGLRLHFQKHQHSEPIYISSPSDRQPSALRSFACRQQHHIVVQSHIIVDQRSRRPRVRRRTSPRGGRGARAFTAGRRRSRAARRRRVRGHAPRSRRRDRGGARRPDPQRSRRRSHGRGLSAQAQRRDRDLPLRRSHADGSFGPATRPSISRSRRGRIGSRRFGRSSRATCRQGRRRASRPPTSVGEDRAATARSSPRSLLRRRPSRRRTPPRR